MVVVKSPSGNEYGYQPQQAQEYQVAQRISDKQKARKQASSSLAAAKRKFLLEELKKPGSKYVTSVVGGRTIYKEVSKEYEKTYTTSEGQKDITKDEYTPHEIHMSNGDVIKEIHREIRPDTSKIYTGYRPGSSEGWSRYYSYKPYETEVTEFAVGGKVTKYEKYKSFMSDTSSTNAGRKETESYSTFVAEKYNPEDNLVHTRTKPRTAFTGNWEFNQDNVLSERSKQKLKDFKQFQKDQTGPLSSKWVEMKSRQEQILLKQQAVQKFKDDWLTSYKSTMEKLPASSQYIKPTSRQQFYDYLSPKIKEKGGLVDTTLTAHKTTASVYKDGKKEDLGIIETGGTDVTVLGPGVKYDPKFKGQLGSGEMVPLSEQAGAISIFPTLTKYVVSKTEKFLPEGVKSGIKKEYTKKQKELAKIQKDFSLWAKPKIEAERERLEELKVKYSYLPADFTEKQLEKKGKALVEEYQKEKALNKREYDIKTRQALIDLDPIWYKSVDLYKTGIAKVKGARLPSVLAGGRRGVTVEEGFATTSDVLWGAGEKLEAKREKYGFTVPGPFELGAKGLSTVYNWLAEDPVGVPITYGISFALGGPLTALSKRAVIGPAIKVVGGGLMAMYGLTVTEQLLSAKTKRERWNIAGREASRIFVIQQGIRAGAEYGLKEKVTITKSKTYIAPKTSKGITKTGAGTKQTKGLQTIKTDHGKILIRGEGDIKIKYPRYMKTYATTGAKAKAVTVSEGKVVRMGESFKMESVTVGRKGFTVLTGKKYSIFIQQKGTAGSFKYVKTSGKVFKKGTYDVGKDPFGLGELKTKIHIKELGPARKPYYRGTKEGGAEHIYRWDIKEKWRVRFAGIKEKAAGLFKKETVKFGGEAKGTTRQIDVASKGKDIIKSNVLQFKTKRGAFDTTTTKKGGITTVKKLTPHIEHVRYDPAYKPTKTTIKHIPQKTVGRTGPRSIEHTVVRPELKKVTGVKSGFESKFSYEKGFKGPDWFSQKGVKIQKFTGGRYETGGKWIDTSFQRSNQIVPRYKTRLDFKKMFNVKPKPAAKVSGKPYRIGDMLQKQQPIRDTGKVEDWLAKHRSKYGTYKQDPTFMGPGQRTANQQAITKHKPVHEPDYIVKTKLEGPDVLVGQQLKTFEQQQIQHQAGVVRTIQEIKPELKVVPILTSRTEVKLDTKALTETKAKTDIKSILKTDVKVDTKALTKTLTETKTETLTKTKTKTATKTQTQTETQTRTLTPTLTLTPSKTPAPVIELPTPPPPTPKTFGLPALPKRGSMAYAVEVRRRGMFEEIGKARTPKEAFLMGKIRVEQTAAASLRVKPLGKPEELSKAAWGVLGKKKFRSSKVDPGVFIQKRSFRIGTAGEKGEITRKGLLTLKLKREEKEKKRKRRKKSMFDIF